MVKSADPDLFSHMSLQTCSVYIYKYLHSSFSLYVTGVKGLQGKDVHLS